MKISSSTVTKLVLSELENLDPVALYLEDVSDGAGKVIITCFSSSWTHYWSHMGEGNTLSKFIQKCSVSYLAMKFMEFMDGEKDTEYDVEKTVLSGSSTVIKMRKDREISKDVARDLWDFLLEVDELPSDYGYDADNWVRIFGEEFWNSFETKPTYDYEYLCRVLEQVKLGLKQIDDEKGVSK